MPPLGATTGHFRRSAYTPGPWRPSAAARTRQPLTRLARRSPSAICGRHVRGWREPTLGVIASPAVARSSGLKWRLGTYHRTGCQPAAGRWTQRSLEPPGADVGARLAPLYSQVTTPERREGDFAIGSGDRPGAAPGLCLHGCMEYGCTGCLRFWPVLYVVSGSIV